MGSSTTSKGPFRTIWPPLGLEKGFASSSQGPYDMSSTPPVAEATTVERIESSNACRTIAS